MREGSKAVVYLACTPEVRLVSGKYFMNNSQPRLTRISYERDPGERLWKLSEQLTQYREK